MTDRVLATADEHLEVVGEHLPHTERGTRHRSEPTECGHRSVVESQGCSYLLLGEVGVVTLTHELHVALRVLQPVLRDLVFARGQAATLGDATQLTHHSTCGVGEHLLG